MNAVSCAANRRIVRGVNHEIGTARAVVWICVLLVPWWTATGCRSTTPTKQSEDEVQTSRTEIERGPVKVIVEVSPSPARLSDEPQLTLTIAAEEGVEVEPPPFGGALGEFLIRDFREPLPETSDGRQISRQVYTLEPMQTGTLQIDPIVVGFVDNREQGDGKQHTVETEALAVEVLSVVKDQAPSLDELAGFAEPVELPEPASRYLWWLGAAVSLLGAVGLVVWRLSKRRGAETEKQFTPRELAHLEFERLERDQLSQHDVKRFYVELTGIVRRYIERTTGVRAAEQTTEEFLREISSGSRFARAERQRLKDFLESADLVKFAAHQPAEDDIDESLLRARVFVGLGEQEVVS